MRTKEKRLIITFHTTSDAMAMEAACKSQGIEGRLIPVPRQISAGCGLAWCAKLSQRDALVEMMKNNGLENEEIHEVEIFV